MVQFKKGDIVHRIREEFPGTVVKLQKEADENSYSFSGLDSDEKLWKSVVWEDSTVYPFHEEGKELIVRESNLHFIDGRYKEELDH